MMRAFDNFQGNRIENFKVAGFSCHNLGARRQWRLKSHASRFRYCILPTHGSCSIF